MTLYIIAGLVVAAGIAYFVIRRNIRKSLEADQAKAGLDIAKKQNEVAQPLPRETEDALRKGDF